MQWVIPGLNNSEVITSCNILHVQFLPARASEQGNVSESVRILLASERSERDTLRSVQSRIVYIIIYVIVINHMRGLYGIYKSRDTRAKPEWQGFMNRVQTERWFITIL